MVLLEPLERDLLRLGMRLQRRVENLFLDPLVDLEELLEALEELRARLLGALGRLFAVGEHLLDRVVVVLEQRKWRPWILRDVCWVTGWRSDRTLMARAQSSALLESGAAYRRGCN